MTIALMLALLQGGGTTEVCPFQQAVFGQEEVKLDGNAVVDSYTGAYDPANPGSNGDVRSNKDVELNGNALVRGDAAAGQSVIFNGNNAQVTGSVTEGAAAIDYPILAALVASKADANDNANISAGLTGTAFKLQGTQSVELPGGSYYFTDFKMLGESKLTLTGPAIFYVDGGVDVSGKARLNDGGDPTNLLILSAADANKPIKVAGQSKAWALFYGMATKVDLSVNAEVFGAVVTREFKISGNAQLHYPAAAEGKCIGVDLETDEPTKQFGDE